MKQQLFEDSHQALWQAFAKRLIQLEGDKPPAGGAMLDSAEFPAAYRRICQHLALARERRYSSRLSDYLGDLALRGYQQIYRAPQSRWAVIIEFLLAGFPRLVRREWRLFWLCSALFYLPLLAMGYTVYAAPETIYSLLDYATVAEFESMYQEDHVIARQRDSQSDVMMLGHYIHNNIGIGFRTFAAGILFGIGSIFVLIFNGVFIGAIAGYITVRGYADTFFSFVVGHGAFELTAIVLAGVSGLRLGLALVTPGPYTRAQALRLAAATSIRIVYGVMALLLLAAFVEAFWSSAQLSHGVKYTVGGTCWLLVSAYLCLAGRDAA